MVEWGGPDDYIPMATNRPKTIFGDTAVCVGSWNPCKKNLDMDFCQGLDCVNWTHYFCEMSNAAAAASVAVT